MRRKKILPLSILLLIVLSVLSVDMIAVSAVVSPYIGVIPDSIVDLNLTPGENFTVSIYTNYTGTDEWLDYIHAWQFALTYNPSVLNGVEVVNGDLITGEGTSFGPGPFDNEAGELSLTIGYFNEAGDVTSGPGTLANVTFTVVDYGASDITIDSHSKLIGWDWFREPCDYDLINAAEQPEQIQHGYFQNVETITRDVAVTSVTPASTSVAVGTSVDIMVDVTNEGDMNEGFDVTAYANATFIETQNVANLGSGGTTTLTFTWDTTGVTLGNYAINATASKVPSETDTADNTLVSSQTVTVREPIIPKAVIIIATEEADYYVNETFILDGISSYDPDGGTIIAYEWDFDDGTYATGRQVTHEYTTIGTYYVSLIVTDSQNEVSHPAYVTITCEEDPVIPPDYAADLIKWKAKPEAKNWDESNDVDKLVTLTALAGNLGTKPVNVAITFTILDAYDVPAGPVIVVPATGIETVTGELVGVGDGTTTEFSLDNTLVVPGTDTIYFDETIVTGYDIDYEAGIITFTSAPGLETVTGEVVGVGDGTTTEFNLDNTPVVPGTETITVKGVVQTRDTDYSIDYESGTITFTSAPKNKARIEADYDYISSVSITADYEYELPPLVLPVGEDVPIDALLDPYDYGYNGTKILLFAHVKLEYYDADTETWIPASTKIVRFAVGP